MNSPVTIDMIKRLTSGQSDSIVLESKEKSGEITVSRTIFRVLYQRTPDANLFTCQEYQNGHSVASVNFPETHLYSFMTHCSNKASMLMDSSTVLSIQ